MTWHQEAAVGQAALKHGHGHCLCSCLAHRGCSGPWPLSLQPTFQSQDAPCLEANRTPGQDFHLH